MTPRLYAVVKCAGACETVCDIGSDHAYIPIYMLCNSLCRHAYVTDINDGPLKRARDNAGRFGLLERITFIKGNGLEPVKDVISDVVIIAGMGGLLISNIIEAQKSSAQKPKKLILQPMNAHEILRKYLNTSGFTIADETAVKEGNKLYVVMTAIHKEDISRQELWYYTGNVLFDKRDDLCIEYLDRIKRGFVKKYNGLEKSNNPDSRLLDKYEKMIDEINAVRERF